MRQELIWTWAAALGAAGMGGMFSIARAVIELNPHGVATEIIPCGVNVGMLCVLLQHGFEVYLIGSVIMLSLGLAENVMTAPTRRRVSDRA